MTLTIAQVENPAPGRARRTLELAGSLGPLDGMMRGVTQRASIEWLPGSGVAAVRLDGPEEQPTDLRFRWRGRRFAQGEAKLDGREIQDLDTLVEILRALVSDPALVDVTWRGQTQRAVLLSFEPEEQLAHEYDATLSIGWVRAASARPLRLGAAPNALGFFGKLQASFEDGMAEAESAITMARGPIDEANRAIARVRGNIARVGNAAESLRNVAQSANGVKKAIGDTIQLLITTTEDVADAMAVSSDQLAQATDAGMQIRARRYRAETLRASRVARYQAALERRNYRAEDDVLAVHSAVDGDTIWSVARFWYGDPRLGPMLARRNNLISSALRPGQRIVIPRPEDDAGTGASRSSSTSSRARVGGSADDGGNNKRQG